MSFHDFLSIFAFFYMMLGIPVAYGGLGIYRFFLGILGAFAGLIVGGLAGLTLGITMKADFVIIAILVLIAAVFGASIGYNLIHLLQKFLAGATGFIGGLTFGAVASVFINTDPLAIGLPLGLVAALATIIIQDWTVAISTAFTGSAIAASGLAFLFGGTQAGVGLAVIMFVLVFLTGIFAQAFLFIGSDTRLYGPSRTTIDDPYDLSTREAATSRRAPPADTSDPYDLSAREAATGKGVSGRLRDNNTDHSSKSGE